MMMMQSKRRARRRVRFGDRAAYIGVALVMIALMLITLRLAVLISGGAARKTAYDSAAGASASDSAEDFSDADAAEGESVEAFAAAHGIALSEYPDELLALMEKHPEASDFVLEYPLKKGTVVDADLTEYADCDAVPQLYQWDARWGYGTYAGNLFALSGCGPTALSMVAIYVLNDTSLTPLAIAAFSAENGWAVEGSGTSWTLMSEGARALGLDVTEIPLDGDRVARNLAVDNPIICVVGPGDFTDTGHFIVLTGIDSDGNIRVNDPNSSVNSARAWRWDELEDQILNLWVYR